MERKTQKLGLINLVMLVLVGAAAFALAKYSNTLAGLTATIFLGLGVLVAAISWFQMGLEEREKLEKMEFEELTRSASSSALFNTGETEVFPAQRSREQFERFFVPGFTVLLCLLQIGGAVLLWRWLQKIITVPLNEPAVPAAFFAVFFLLLFLPGKYSTGIARMEKLRLLRPGASYLLLNAYLSALVVLAIVLVWLGFPEYDLYAARVLAGLLLLVGIESLISLIFELYRPRVKGKVERPVYESRLVSLLGQPEGLYYTAAQTLDYQFGFKVSETWAFQLLKQWFPRLILIQLAVMLFSTCFVFIDAGQEGLLEHNGTPAGVLKPGAHFTWPWPIDRVYRYATEQIQTINIGFVPDDSPMAGNTVLWTTPHNKEENFLVANREMPALENQTNDATAGNRAPPVSLLTVSIPVQFQITNLTAWVYNNEDPVGLLTHISTREVVRYLVSVDLEEIMSRSRWDAAQALRTRIQAAADIHKLGANIVFVGLQDIHPPGKVAPDYEKVVSAIQTKEATILSARAEAIKAINIADAQAFTTVTDARADSTRRRVDAMAQAALFTNQLPAYLAAPAVYAQRAYLETFTRSITNARTYVMLATNTQDVIILDLEDKIRKDILESATLPPPKNAPKPNP
ncbi:MAG TPA: protease modulator HflK [Verrucomicrobiae bacterium]|jgi:regulator of protease activity HflC (stomatin/prohibitin superfamily)|nr:protease modulator HflK [Verrucomicrobiae bacterium]